MSTSTETGPAKSAMEKFRDYQVAQQNGWRDMADRLWLDYIEQCMREMEEHMLRKAA